MGLPNLDRLALTTPPTGVFQFSHGSEGSKMLNSEDAFRSATTRPPTSVARRRRCAMDARPQTPRRRRMITRETSDES